MSTLQNLYILCLVYTFLFETEHKPLITFQKWIQITIPRLQIHLWHPLQETVASILAITTITIPTLGLECHLQA